MLFEFFNLCFDQSTIPNVWLKAIIFPIPKSKDCDPRLPLNYRGISLLSCISKIYSKILNNRLSNYLEDNNLLVSEQNGFRKQRSCQDHLFSLNAVVKNRLSKNMSTYAAFIDLRKAFDCVNREFLYYKLGKFGIVGKLYFAIKSLYKQTESCVQLNDIYTDWFNIESGVRQGDSLSPTLFALFVNDLAKDVNKLNLGIDINGRNLCMLLYADDIVLLSDSPENLQSLLSELNKWCDKWQMKINCDKSKIMHFRQKSVPKTHSVLKLV